MGEKVKILNTYWGASRDDVLHSAEEAGWDYDGTPEDYSCRSYKGTLFGREVLLEYHFTPAYPSRDPGLKKIEFVFWEPKEEGLWEFIEGVLTKKYGNRTNDTFYTSASPTWFADGGQTVIQMKFTPQNSRAAKLVVDMSYNGEGAESRKVDYFQEGLEKM